MSIQVGDKGTTYVVPIRDNGVTFDPSTAATKQMRFLFPGQATVTRTASVEQRTIHGVLEWCLVYTMVPANDAAIFHAAAGLVSVQGVLVYDSDREWSTQPITLDAERNRLRVRPNL